MPHGCAAFFIRGGFLKNEGQGMVTGMASELCETNSKRENLYSLFRGRDTSFDTAYWRIGDVGGHATDATTDGNGTFRAWKP